MNLLLHSAPYAGVPPTGTTYRVVRHLLESARPDLLRHPDAHCTGRTHLIVDQRPCRLRYPQHGRTAGRHLLLTSALVECGTPAEHAPAVTFSSPPAHAADDIPFEDEPGGLTFLSTSAPRASATRDRYEPLVDTFHLHVAPLCGPPPNFIAQRDVQTFSATPAPTVSVIQSYRETGVANLLLNDAPVVAAPPSFGTHRSVQHPLVDRRPTYSRPPSGSRTGGRHLSMPAAPSRVLPSLKAPDRSSHLPDEHAQTLRDTPKGHVPCSSPSSTTAALRVHDNPGGHTHTGSRRPF